MLTPKKPALNTTAVMTTSSLWTLFLSVMLTMGTTRAQGEIRPPLPPPPSSQMNPTWPGLVDGGKPTPATGEETRDPLSELPWWWWVPVAGGAGLVFVVVVVVCVCFCCRRKRRGRNLSGQDGDVEIHAPPTDFRRMESSAAKRYLHNIASVFSWGSEFEAEGTRPRRPSSHVIYANSAQSGGSGVVYANAQTLGIPGGVGSASAQGRKSGQHYHNLA